MKVHAQDSQAITSLIIGNNSEPVREVRKGCEKQQKTLSRRCRSSHLSSLRLAFKAAIDVDLICAENLAQRLPVSSWWWEIKASSGHHPKSHLQEIKEIPWKHGDIFASRRNRLTLL